MKKKSKRNTTSDRRVPVAPGLGTMLRGQLMAFDDRFKHEAAPGDPALFDPDKDIPTPFDREDGEDVFADAAVAAGVDPAIAYAMKKTGMIVAETNVHLFSEEDVKEWEEAVDKGRRLFRSGRPSGREAR